MRACIGRAFAWQEALLATALILQNFDITLDDPAYEMKIVQTLTIKPKDFYMRAKLRTGITATALQERLMSIPGSGSRKLDVGPLNGLSANGDGSSITILYGSNTGTCQALAQKLSTRAKQSGLNVTMSEMDSAVAHLPKDQPVVIITASYEGQPTDNAVKFVSWVELTKDSKVFSGLKYAVYGCGHRDWKTTFHRIPKLLDEKLGQLGGLRIAPIGTTDVSQGTIFDDFDSWVDKELWPALAPSEALAKAPSAPSTVTLELLPQGREAHLQQNLQWANVLDSKQLTKPGFPEKRHIKIELPSGMTYQAGDYLAVLPLNPEDTVKRVMKHFNLPWDGVVTITDSGPSILPTNSPMPVFDLLRGYVELSQPATIKAITTLAAHAADATEAAQLRALAAAPAHTAQVVAPRLSALDLLGRHGSVGLGFGQFLGLLPPLRPRQYSISSSALADARSCTLTFGVIAAASFADPALRFEGVAGSYLAALRPGDRLLVGVRAASSGFRLPSDPEATPVVMFGAGSGIAPFRGFIEERATLIREGGRKLAPAVLFFGCRDPEGDSLYAEQLNEWEKLGAVEVKYAFSRDVAKSEGCKYVQDRMIKDSDEVVKMWEMGAKVYVCGAPEVAQELGKAARKLVMETVKSRCSDIDDQKVEEWMKSWRGERVVSDVFA